MSTDRFQPATLRHPALAKAMGARLLMLILVVWVALLYSGIGNAMGVPPDVVANRIEARMLAQLRQNGTSQASRWTRAEPSVEISAWSAASSPPVLPHDPCAATLPLPGFFFEPLERLAEPSVLAGLPARAVPRWQTPLTRAPPFKALEA